MVKAEEEIKIWFEKFVVGNIIQDWDLLIKSGARFDLEEEKLTAFQKGKRTQFTC